MYQKLGLIISIGKILLGGLIGLISFLLMWNIVWQYSGGDLQMDFLLTKQEYIHLMTYRLSFYVHIFSSIWLLPMGVVLLSKLFLKKFTKIHRLLGKAYVFLVLGFAAPSGLIMSLFANGGFPSIVNFAALSIAWWLVTLLGYKTIKAGLINQHKIWMMRSVALSYSAITLRILQLLFSQFSIFGPEEQYLIAAILSWVINLAVVETYLRFSNKTKFTTRELISAT